MKVIVKNIRRIFDDFFKIDRAVIQHEKFDGTMTNDIIRYNFERGNSVAILIVNPSAKTVIFTTQFRFPSYASDHSKGWLMEIPAGMVEYGHSPEETAIREVHEETGYHVAKLTEIYNFYPSPGGSSERVFLYYAEVNTSNRTGEGGGVKKEGEDIQIMELPLTDAFQMMDDGQIYDAKTIIALQWLRWKNQN